MPDRHDRVEMKRWLDDWAQAGPRLERERWKELSAMTDEDARRIAGQVLALWQPEWPTDEGEGLLLQQRVFARARRTP